MKRSILASIFAVTLMFGLAGAASAAQSVKMSPRQARELAANAKTPTDHMKLSEYYSAEADRYEVEAQEHQSLSEIYRNHPSVVGSKSGIPLVANAQHCANLAQSLRDAAKSGRELAAEHAAMAKDAGK
ncbi:MAG: hypothetical protein KGN84_20600 [Acidobacteriota bacterium]|nr:hypothetical protein [Acidobacteriota bacterium]